MLKIPIIGSRPEWQRNINPWPSDRRRTLASNHPGTGNQHLGSFIIDDTITAVIEPQSFVCDCIVRGLQAGGLDGTVNGFPDVASYLERLPDVQMASIVLLSALHTTGQKLDQDLERLRHYCRDAAKIVIIGHVEGPLNQYAIQNGLRGVFPANLPLQIAIEALKWIRAGGVYVPANDGEQRHSATTLEALFTSKQIKVIEGLKKGKSNKAIAYELNICESTVKVHVRAIMRKLECRSRTEVVFKVGELLEQKREPTAIAVSHRDRSFEAAETVSSRNRTANGDEPEGFFTAF